MAILRRKICSGALNLLGGTSTKIQVYKRQGVNGGNGIFPSGFPDASDFGGNDGDTPAYPSVHGPNDSRLGAGAIAGIAVGTILFLFVVMALLAYFCAGGSRWKEPQQPPEERMHDRQERHDLQQQGQRQRQQDVALHPQPHRFSRTSSEEVVAFAKVGDDEMAWPRDDPPAYGESEADNAQHNVTYTLGAVSNGFQRYRISTPIHSDAKLDTVVPPSVPERNERNVSVIL
ncbi:hypothetical protein SPI_07504 [Niveomyces insectorum RCEF 264]|uniref:Uncharacterized protein n=1 Tax=Niveomyces insectorum RCEF 264 TaxID=1081102 RepID=A0A167PXS6_9HYPO|nr:hypothetical protein SPI_07504 [Niveomyces insectorum RCEF 264]